MQIGGIDLSGISLFSDPIFAEAMADIQALGFRVSDRPEPGMIPYGVVSGRSNPRWWLVPLVNRQVAVSGMAIFQPALTSASILKNVAMAASLLGLSSLWARKKVYIAGDVCLQDVFHDKNLLYSFFTGTNSPHRKVTIQIMDKSGGIRGYAKISRNPSVKQLLTHESEMLGYLEALNLKTALIPTVLFRGAVGNAGILVTDTLKTARTKTSITLDSRHLSFLVELAEKTTKPPSQSAWHTEKMKDLYEAVAEGLPAPWQARLQICMGILKWREADVRYWCLCHGDFTPWNTFFIGKRLYIIDWEYAQMGCSAGYDLIHYIFALPERKTQSIPVTVNLVRKLLRELGMASNNQIADILFIYYLCIHALQFAARQFMAKGFADSWDGEQDMATYLDALMQMQ